MATSKSWEDLMSEVDVEIEIMRILISETDSFIERMSGPGNVHRLTVRPRFDSDPPQGTHKLVRDV